jgi:hypothetical protein
MAKGWKRPFDEPIVLTDGRQLVTLDDAGNYITELPEAVHEAEEWQVSNGGLDPGCDVGRPDDVCTHRRHEGIKPPRRAGVQP